MVGEYARTARAAECHQRFQNERVPIARASCHGGLEHRIFAGHLVGEDGHLEALLHPPHDVEIGQAGLDHHRVRPLREVERHFAQRFFRVGGVHLVAALVPFQEPARAHRIAERPVEGGRIFGGVGHDLDVLVAFSFQRGPDRAHPPIHHVGRGDDRGARARLVECLVDQHLRGHVVEHASGLIHQPVMAVSGVRIERHVRQDADVGHRVADGAGGAADQVVGVERLLALRRPGGRRRVGEKGEAGDAEVAGFPGARRHPVDRPAGHAGQGGDGIGHTVAFGHEQGPDQVGGRQGGFRHHGAAPRVGAGAAEAERGKGGGGRRHESRLRPA